MICSKCGLPICSEVLQGSMEELRARLNAKQIDLCSQMLTDAGVPEWVQLTGNHGVPSNSVSSRLKWFLARRKNVKPGEIDKNLQRVMAEWESLPAVGTNK